MNAKLELYKRYDCVYRDTQPFSVLIEWADAYLAQLEYDDHIYELALVRNQEEALSLSEKILENIPSNNQTLNIHPIPSNLSILDSIPNNVDYAGLLGEKYNYQEYQINSILIYQIEFETKDNHYQNPITLHTFGCDTWLTELNINKDKIAGYLFKYLENKHKEVFYIYKNAHILDYLFDVISILFNIQSQYSIISLRKSYFSPEEYDLPEIRKEYLTIKLDRNINLLSIS